MGWGLYLAWAAAGLSLVALLLHRFAYKPLFDRMLRRSRETSEALCAV